MVDTKKIKSNLGSRDSIGLKREDVLELIEVYEVTKGTKKYSWSDLAPKH